ncbi:MAG: hypothetical protein QG587_1993 [Chloroflexota bacterium]|nr:hypothetical protein [Chloroflexota bacterium]
MPRALAILLVTLALVTAACGGGGGSGGGGAAASAAGAAPVADGDIPPGSTVFFGSAYDPSTFAVADKTGKITQGQTPIVAVGKALAPVDGTGVQVQIAAGGKPKPLRAPDAVDNPGSASFFAADLSADNLTPGTWIVSFVNPEGRVLASGFLSVGN